MVGSSGIYLENSGAAPLAGLKRLLRTGEITEKDWVLLIGTSHGQGLIKQVNTLTETFVAYFQSRRELHLAELQH